MQLAGDQSQNGGFANAAGAHNGNNAAALNIYADIVQNIFCASTEGQVTDSDDIVLHSVLPPTADLDVSDMSLGQQILWYGIFKGKKNEGDLRLPRRRSVGTPLLVDCRSS